MVELGGAVVLVGIGLAFALPGLYLIWTAVTSYRLATLMDEAARAAIADLAGASDAVVLSGTVEAADEPLRSPVWGDECVAYRYDVDREKSGLGDRTGTVGVTGGETATRFLLDDGTGTVLVDPGDADLRYADEHRRRVDGGTTPPPAIREFLASNDLSMDGDRDWIFEEARYEVGQTVTVVGRPGAPGDGNDPTTADATLAGSGVAVLDLPPNEAQRKLSGGGPMVAAFGAWLLLFPALGASGFLFSIPDGQMFLGFAALLAVPVAYLVGKAVL